MTLKDKIEPSIPYTTKLETNFGTLPSVNHEGSNTRLNRLGKSVSSLIDLYLSSNT